MAETDLAEALLSEAEFDTEVRGISDRIGIKKAELQVERLRLDIIGDVLKYREYLGSEYTEGMRIEYLREA